MAYVTTDHATGQSTTLHSQGPACTGAKVRGYARRMGGAGGGLQQDYKSDLQALLEAGQQARQPSSTVTTGAAGARSEFKLDSPVGPAVAHVW